MNLGAGVGIYLWWFRNRRRSPSHLVQEFSLRRWAVKPCRPVDRYARQKFEPTRRIVPPSPHHSGGASELPWPTIPPATICPSLDTRSWLDAREVILRLAHALLDRRGKHALIIHEVPEMMHPNGNGFRTALCNMETAPAQSRGTQNGCTNSGARCKRSTAPSG